MINWLDFIDNLDHNSDPTCRTFLKMIHIAAYCVHCICHVAAFLNSFKKCGSGSVEFNISFK